MMYNSYIQVFVFPPSLSDFTGSDMTCVGPSMIGSPIFWESPKYMSYSFTVFIGTMTWTISSGTTWIFRREISLSSFRWHLIR